MLFLGSVASDDGKSAQDPSPDKTPNAKTPKERKRKRKNGEEPAEGGPPTAKPGRKTSDNTRTINDYFGKPMSSPGRAHSGAKSPSPSSGQFLPCSPQPPFMAGMGDYRMQPPGMPRAGGVPVMGGGKVVKTTQTDLTAEKIEELETRSSSELEVGHR